MTDAQLAVLLRCYVVQLYDAINELEKLLPDDMKEDKIIFHGVTTHCPALDRLNKIAENMRDAANSLENTKT